MISERKYKVGDVVRTLVDTDIEGHKLFPKGTMGIITEIANYKDSLYPYKVDANDDWWYYNADMIESVDEGGTPKQDPCYDTISRQAAFRQAINAHKMAQENGFDFKDICEEYLNVLPSVTPKQRTGHWIDRTSGYAFNEHCSECGYIVHEQFIQQYHFCPSCGADMRESEEQDG